MRDILYMGAVQLGLGLGHSGTGRVTSASIGVTCFQAAIYILLLLAVRLFCKRVDHILASSY